MVTLPIDYFSPSDPTVNVYNRGTATVAVASITCPARITGSLIARQINLGSLADGEYDIVGELPFPAYFSLKLVNGEGLIATDWSDFPAVVDASQELVTLTVKDVSSNVIAGASVYVTSDIGGNTIVLTDLVSNSVGKIYPRLYSGTYYVWASHPDKTFTNPTTITVTDV